MKCDSLIRSSTPVRFENQIVVACKTIFISATPYPNAPDSFDWTQKYTMESRSLRELLAPKTVNKIGFAANICWTVLGVVLSSVFLDMENNEPLLWFGISLSFNCLWNILPIRQIQSWWTWGTTAASWTPTRNSSKEALQSVLFSACCQIPTWNSFHLPAKNGILSLKLSF